MEQHITLSSQPNSRGRPNRRDGHLFKRLFARKRKRRTTHCALRLGWIVRDSDSRLNLVAIRLSHFRGLCGVSMRLLLLHPARLAPSCHRTPTLKRAHRSFQRRTGRVGRWALEAATDALLQSPHPSHYSIPSTVKRRLSNRPKRGLPRSPPCCARQDGRHKGPPSGHIAEADLSRQNIKPIQFRFIGCSTQSVRARHWCRHGPSAWSCKRNGRHEIPSEKRRRRRRAKGRVKSCITVANRRPIRISVLEESLTAKFSIDAIVNREHPHTERGWIAHSCDVKRLR